MEGNSPPAAVLARLREEVIRARSAGGLRIRIARLEDHLKQVLSKPPPCSRGDQCLRLSQSLECSQSAKCMLSESTTRQALADQLAGRCEGGTPLRTARPCGPREEEPSVAHIAYPPSKVLNHDGTAWTLIDLSVVPPSAMESQRPNWTASPCALANRPLVHSHARDPLCGPASLNHSHPESLFALPLSSPGQRGAKTAAGPQQHTACKCNYQPISEQHIEPRRVPSKCRTRDRQT